MTKPPTLAVAGGESAYQRKIGPSCAANHIGGSQPRIEQAKAEDSVVENKSLTPSKDQFEANVFILEVVGQIVA